MSDAHCPECGGVIADEWTWEAAKNRKVVTKHAYSCSECGFFRLPPVEDVDDNFCAGCGRPHVLVLDKMLHNGVLLPDGVERAYATAMYTPEELDKAFYAWEGHTVRYRDYEAYRMCHGRRLPIIGCADSMFCEKCGQPYREGDHEYRSETMDRGVPGSEQSFLVRTTCSTCNHVVEV